MAPPASPNTNTPIGVATFIATHATELAQLARKQGLDTLGHLLEMAQLEAETVIRQSSGRH
jgi:hypothetical protein